MSTLPISSPISSSTAPVDPSTEPASVRHGGAAAQNAYRTGLAFEQMLVGQLAKQMTDTISGAGADDDGLGGSTGEGSGSDPAAGAYSSMLPDALTSGLMSGGGTGVAMQIARSLDPKLQDGGDR